AKSIVLKLSVSLPNQPVHGIVAALASGRLHAIAARVQPETLTHDVLGGTDLDEATGFVVAVLSSFTITRGGNQPVAQVMVPRGRIQLLEWRRRSPDRPSRGKAHFIYVRGDD